MELEYHTAGESHGPVLAAIVENFPAGVPVAAPDIDRDLARRQQGYGRGGRMRIEADCVEFLGGVRWGRTTGAPIHLAVRNRDWANWQQGMSPAAEQRGSIPPVTEVRPGHADLPAALKYDLDDAREVLERASARETAARVAVGALAKVLLRELGISVGSFVTSVGEVEVAWQGDLANLGAAAERHSLRLPDAAANARAEAAVDDCRAAGDSLGGTFVCFATGVPVGLGSHATRAGRLDARLGQALLSVPAIKGVEIGLGFQAAALRGSQVHDEILPGDAGDGRRGGVRRPSNRAGGLEGGITNGEDVWLRAAMKPIPTLMTPLRTVDLRSGEPVSASRERSDVCAVPAASVVGEAALAFELARAVLEKFGADNLVDLHAGLDAYLERINRRWSRA